MSYCSEQQEAASSAATTTMQQQFQLPMEFNDQEELFGLLQSPAALRPVLELSRTTTPTVPAAAASVVSDPSPALPSPGGGGGGSSAAEEEQRTSCASPSSSSTSSSSSSAASATSEGQINEAAGILVRTLHGDDDDDHDNVNGSRVKTMTVEQQPLQHPPPPATPLTASPFNGKRLYLQAFFGAGGLCADGTPGGAGGRSPAKKRKFPALLTPIVGGCAGSGAGGCLASWAEGLVGGAVARAAAAAAAVGAGSVEVRQAVPPPPVPPPPPLAGASKKGGESTAEASAATAAVASALPRPSPLVSFALPPAAAIANPPPKEVSSSSPLQTTLLAHPNSSSSLAAAGRCTAETASSSSAPVPALASSLLSPLNVAESSFSDDDPAKIAAEAESIVARLRPVLGSVVLPPPGEMPAALLGEAARSGKKRAAVAPPLQAQSRNAAKVNETVTVASRPTALESIVAADSNHPQEVRPVAGGAAGGDMASSSTSMAHPSPASSQQVFPNGSPSGHAAAPAHPILVTDAGDLLAPLAAAPAATTAFRIVPPGGGGSVSAPAPRPQHPSPSQPLRQHPLQLPLQPHPSIPQQHPSSSPASHLQSELSTTASAAATNAHQTTMFRDILNADFGLDLAAEANLVVARCLLAQQGQANDDNNEAKHNDKDKDKKAAETAAAATTAATTTAATAVVATAETTAAAPPPQVLSLLLPQASTAQAHDNVGKAAPRGGACFADTVASSSSSVTDTSQTSPMPQLPNPPSVTDGTSKPSEPQLSLLGGGGVVPRPPVGMRPVVRRKKNTKFSDDNSSRCGGFRYKTVVGSRKAVPGPYESSPLSYLKTHLSSRGYPTDAFSPRTSRRGYLLSPDPLRVASYGSAVLEAAVAATAENGGAAREEEGAGSGRAGTKEGQRPRLAELLSAAGLSPNPCNGAGEDLLHLSCRRGDAAAYFAQVNVVGCTVRVADNSGRTPLHWAVWSHAPEIAADMLGRDPAMILAMDNGGRTPLEYARAEEWEGWVEFVRERGEEFWPSRETRRQRQQQQQHHPPKVGEGPQRQPAAAVVARPPPLPVELAAMVASGRMDPGRARLLAGTAPTRLAAAPTALVLRTPAGGEPRLLEAFATAPLAVPRTTTLATSSSPASAAPAPPPAPSVSNGKSNEEGDQRPGGGEVLLGGKEEEDKRRKKNQKRRTVASKCA